MGSLSSSVSFNPSTRSFTGSENTAFDPSLSVIFPELNPTGSWEASRMTVNAPGVIPFVCAKETHGTSAEACQRWPLGCDCSCTVVVKFRCPWIVATLISFVLDEMDETVNWYTSPRTTSLCVTGSTRQK